ncbi:MAG TPA: phage tail protein [Chthoniobacterales bacterium]|jgi:phage tail-like protein|nr:phage tail protein [Chthoniobacterales bacterium]
MPGGTRNDPYGQFNFLIEIDGVTKGGFSEASGLTTDTNIIEYREGNEQADGQSTTRKLPGLMKYNNIVLKRGWTKDQSLWQWRLKVIEGKTSRTSGSIVLLDEARQPALRWKFREGWPSKWEGPALNGKTSEVAIESLEIAHEGLVLESA